VERFQRALTAGTKAAYIGFIDRKQSEESNQRKLPRCPVAEFAADELRRIDVARAKHLRACQTADKAGLPRPDLKDFLPELFWYALDNDAQN
jgi:hypothetical protein